MNLAHEPSHTTPSRSLRARVLDPFRLAAIVLVVFTVGHTLGAVVSTPRFGAESDAVVAAMKSVHVVAQTADCTWYGFYRSFGALISLWFVFSAVLAWHVGGLPAAARRALAVPLWVFALCHTAGAALAWIYLFPAAQIFSTSVAALLAYGCIRDARRIGLPHPPSTKESLS